MKRTFSVRSKILFAVGTSIVVLSLLLYVISTQVLLASYLAIERETMTQDVRRATDAIAEFQDQQMIKLSDWAAWDEAYAYGVGRDRAWVDATIVTSGMANLDINVAMFTDLQGVPFYLKTVDIETREEVASTSVAAYIAAHPELVRHTELDAATEGIAMLGDTPLIVVSLPLRTSEGLGPIPGSITFARYLDAAKVQELSNITHLAISVYPYEATDVPADVAQAREQLMNGAMHVVTPQSDDVIAGYAVVHGIDGAPALIIRVETPRPIYSQGIVTLLTFMGIGIIALIAFGLVILFLLERFVIARFVQLAVDVEKINVDKDLSIKVRGGVKDEIGRLADKINQLLGWLSQARDAEAATRREIINLLDEQKRAKDQADEMAQLLKGK